MLLNKRTDIANEEITQRFASRARRSAQSVPITLLWSNVGTDAPRDASVRVDSPTKLSGGQYATA